MKSILLKLDDRLFEETEKRVKAEKTNRLNYIKRAIEQYNILQERKDFEAQIAKEVQLLREFDPDVALKKEFEEISITDLQKFLDE